MTEKQFQCGKRLFTARSEKTLSDISVKTVSENGEIFLYEIECRFAEKAQPSDAVLFWDEPPEGITGWWSPVNGRNRCIPQGWYPQRQYSTLTDGAPLMALFSDRSMNYRTYALSEAEKPMELSLWLRNDPGRDTLRVQLHLFRNEAPGTDCFSLLLRIDERPLPLPECIKDVSGWWRTFYPSDAREYSSDFAGDRPLFSSWYACFQNPEQETLEKELPVLAEFGFGSMIIDDGWSYDSAGNGAYSFCGEWEVSRVKFPDMAGFVRKAHDFGIKVALWFPIPFVGKQNPDYERFRGKILADTMDAGVLDPRFPEVRAYIVGNYVNILKKYGLDGCKLDFLTDFNRPAPENITGIDCSTVNEGVTKLLASIEEEVRSLDPDMLIEYRVSYIGPSVIRHCNMLRMCDCAFDFITNRIGVIDLRLLDHPVAVHSDMLLWGPEETPENIAVMLLNVLFAVPQISVLTAEMDECRRAVLKNYLSYWTVRREILLHGSMTVLEPQANYSFASAENAELRIGVCYLPRVFSFDGKATDLFNAGTQDGLYIESCTKGIAVCYDIAGEKTAMVPFGKGVMKLPVSRGGRAALREI